MPIASSEAWWLGRNVYYPGSGFAIDVPLNYTSLMTVWDSLSKNLFVDRQTRVLIVDFNLYNAGVNQHVAARLSFEFLETGGVTPRADFTPIRIFRYRGIAPHNGNSVLALEVIIIVTIGLYLVHVCS